ncbi:MAG: hypothetical protein AAF195_04035 [Pseudomonadota bacterium]
MAYNLSDQQEAEINNQDNTPDQIDLGKIATVFIVFGLLSLITSWVYSFETEKVASSSFKPNKTGVSAEVGPINSRKNNETYKITVRADLASQSWSHIEGQVLDSKKKFLFSFGKELSYYSGRSSDGNWVEKEDNYSINITFPQVGTYYLKFNSESDRSPRNIEVKINKKRGSILPHLWFGIILIIIGLIVNELKNRTLRKIWNKLD